MSIWSCVIEPWITGRHAKVELYVRRVIKPTVATGNVIIGDSTLPNSFDDVAHEVDWIVTSPPYYGMRTYLPDQWLRLWFVGGTAEVCYSKANQLSHRSRAEFAEGLRRVWVNCANVSRLGAKMVIRVGAINDRKLDPRKFVKDSLAETNWRILTGRDAGSASGGRRGMPLPE